MMAEYGVGQRVLVDAAAGIVPGVTSHSPDWQMGTVRELLANGFYRIELDAPIAGRTALKDAAPEHVRALA
jgi:hypothetical protein